MRTDELQRGIELFNSGEFLQCHDYLEELIPFESGQAAEFFHGLMELAADLDGRWPAALLDALG